MMYAPIIWATLGAIFLGIELVAMQFVTLWFGLSALLLAFITYFAPNMPIALQIVIWMLVSSGLVALWFLKLKNNFATPPNEQQLNQIVGQIGYVIDVNPITKEGIARFTVPVFGKNEWSYIAHSPTQIGQKIEVTGINKDKLIIEPMQLINDY